MLRAELTENIADRQTSLFSMVVWRKFTKTIKTDYKYYSYAMGINYELH